MKNNILLLIVSTLFLFSCSNSSQIKNSIDLVKNIAEENYEAVLNETDDMVFQQIGRDSFKVILTQAHEYCQSNLGNELEYTFLFSKKTYSSNESLNNNFVQILVASPKQCFISTINYNPKTDKVVYINFGEIHKNPSMSVFIVAAILGLAIVVFNIFTIVKIKKSNLKKKWIYYLLVIVLNLPFLLINPGNIKLLIPLGIQLLGYSYQYFGPLSYVKIGIPLGAIITWIKLKKAKEEEV